MNGHGRTVHELGHIGADEGFVTEPHDVPGRVDGTTSQVTRFLLCHTLVSSLAGPDNRVITEAV